MVKEILDFNMDLLDYNNDYLIDILNSTGEKQQELWNKAVEIRNKNVGNKVYIRGLIEFSNICRKNCLYCGIRAGNSNVKRYRLTIDEIMECVDFIFTNNIPSIVLQSGEMVNDEFKEYLISIIKTIKGKYKNAVITLSSGEFDYEFYKLLHDLGVERYLLRIESSNPELYSKIHPSDHSHKIRKQCLLDLKKANYQVGTGNMIGVPQQTDNDIINDLRFFVENDFDMFGLGPYIIHTETPLATKENIKNWNREKDNILNKTLNFIAMLRICMPNVNIATATALDVISPNGRISALKAGANVIMPSITPIKNKQNYLLYQNKPNVDDERETIIQQMEAKIRKANMIPAYNEAGSSLHYKDRNKLSYK